MITRFIHSLLFITAIFLMSGGLAYLMALDGAEFRAIDRPFVLSTPMYLFSNLLGVFGLLGMYESHRFYKRGDEKKALVRLLASLILLIASILFTHFLFMEGLKK